MELGPVKFRAQLKTMGVEVAEEEAQRNHLRIPGSKWGHHIPMA